MTRELKEDLSITVPTGAIIPFGGEGIPEGYVECDGTAYNTEEDITFADLYAVIGNAWGGTDNTDFRLPDLRGEFLRGLDSGKGSDPDSSAPSPIACTFTASTNTVNSAGHGLWTSSRVMFLTINTTTGISINTPYFVWWENTFNTQNNNDFKLSLAEGGPAIELTNNGSGTFINLTQHRIKRYFGGNEGDNVGSYQYDEFKSHVHSVSGYYSSGHEGGDDVQQVGIQTAPYPFIAGEGNENRPRNAYVKFLIKK